jgi:hypothetical protein
LGKDGFLTLNERDAIEIEHVEDYLLHDPFEPLTRTPGEHEHPWNRVYSEGVMSEVMRRGLLREMEAIDWTKLPKE